MKLVLSALAGLASLCLRVLAQNDDCAATTNSDNLVQLSFGQREPLVISDGRLTTATLTLRDELRAAPPVAVEISAPGITCSQTRFEFRAGDAQTFRQTTTCRTDAGRTRRPNGAFVPVDIQFTYFFGGTGTDGDVTGGIGGFVDEGDGLTGGFVGGVHGAGFGTPSDGDFASIVVPKVCRKLTVRRRVINSGTGVAVGDPHMLTLDRASYGFQVPGVFRLFESGRLVVQVFQEKCKPVAHRGASAPSCYQGVVVAFADSVARFFLENGRITVAKGSNDLKWLSIERARGSADAYRVFVSVDEGTYVDVSRTHWIKNYALLNVNMVVSPFFKDSSVQGLLGNWNDNRFDDIRDAARLAKLHGASLNNNLFTCSDCSSMLKPPTANEDLARSVGTPIPVLHDGFSLLPASTIHTKAFNPQLARRLRGTSAADSQSSSSTAGSGSQGQRDVGSEDTVLPPDHSARINELCAFVIRSVPICDRYVANPGFFIEDVCIGDGLALNDLSVVDSTKLAYLRECRRELDSRLAANASTPIEAETLQQDRDSLMFGDISSCSQGCSGQGECLPVGCSCHKGFTGFACDIVV
ncbi:hypothetical protein P43SY_012116 [Pythium insidiosum]|uniref:VWFD domain-containing protein n=1 Tax=Pythium insidiosum TaxID=114742 RepID=A0AAD5M1E4_PYTIN|nr:hypothetical protein P43SY_012116 [Pythium insidiosum]